MQNRIREAMLCQWKNRNAINRARYQLMLEDSDLIAFEYNVSDDYFTYVYRSENGILQTRIVEEYLEHMNEVGTIMEVDIEKYREAVQDGLRHPVDSTFSFHADFDGSGQYKLYMSEYISIPDEEGKVIYVCGKVQQISFDKCQYETDSIPGMLIVDDVEMNRASLREIFDKQYHIWEAADGREALDILMQETSIQIMLLDLQMPVLNGFEVLEQIHFKAAYKNLTTIVCTAYGEEENQIRALELGAYDCVNKTYNPDLIKHRINNVLQGKRNNFINRRYQFDPLTGIYNRTGFYHATRNLLDCNPDKTFYIIAWDIRRFKVINELFGTRIGDQLLQQMANYLMNMHLPNTTYGRMESDTFIVCLPIEELDESTIAAKTKQQFHSGQIHYEYTICLGLYKVHNLKLTINAMCDRTILALQMAKKDHIKNYYYYDEKLRNQMVEEQELTAEFGNAIKQEEFQVYYQPIYDVYSEKIASAEALIRWKHPERGMIPPDKFIALFENNGFISVLDQYVLRQVCECIRRRLQAGQVVVPVSVNLSRVDFYQKDLAEQVLSVVDEFKVPHEYIRVEITESAYAQNENMLLCTVNQLKEYGFGILMDDFGSGYSSLNNLKDIPVDILKIDLRFLESFETNKKSADIITSIIRMAKVLGMKVITEGVETIEQLNFLRLVGCNRIQGYYYSKPLPYEEFAEKLTESQVMAIGGYQKKLEEIDFSNMSDTVREYQNMLGESDEGMGIYEMYGHELDILRVNDKYYQVMGETAKEVFQYSRVSVKTIYPACYPLLFQTCIKAKETEEQVVVFCNRLNFDGKNIQVKINVRFLFGENERSAYFFTIGEIEDMKKGE